MVGHGTGKRGFAHPSEAYTLSLTLADPQPQDKNLRDYAATLRVPGGNIWTGTLEENRRLAKKTKAGWRLKGDIKKTIWVVPDSVVGKAYGICMVFVFDDIYFKQIRNGKFSGTFMP